MTCPMCKKPLQGTERECPVCHTDVSLLADYVDNLQDGLVRAEALTRRGELGEAVWAYLAVLEVDPDNAAARRQVGQVATAVREFDRVNPPGRRWIKGRPRPGFLRRWFGARGGAGEPSGARGLAFLFVLVLGAFVIGYAAGRGGPAPGQPQEQQNPAGEQQPAAPAAGRSQDGAR
jgi:hypothetical protein